MPIRRSSPADRSRRRPAPTCPGCRISSAAAGSSRPPPTCSTSTTRRVGSVIAHDAALDRPPTSTPRSPRRPAGVSRLERDAAGRPRAGDVPLQGAARGALRGAGPHRHHRARQDARRGARQRPARHRVRRGGLRRRRRCCMGYGLENIAHRHRLPRRCASRSASAPRSRRSTFPAMVPLWFLPFAVAAGNTFIAQAVRAGAAVAAADVRAARAVRPAARRRQPGQRRPRGRRGDLRSSRHPRGVVRRLDAGGAGSSTSARRTPASGSRRSAARRTSSS